MKKVKLSVELPQEAYERLERLGHRSDLTLSQVFIHALALYDLVSEQLVTGGKLIIRNNNIEREILLSEFETKKRN